MSSQITIEAAKEGSFPGEILRFRDAVLARVETNQNLDEITEDNLHEAANGLPLLPLDIEHRESSIVGMFTDANVENLSLITSGIIYARRFPYIIDGFIQGKNFLSIEGYAEQIMCSKCGGKFKAKEEFCQHLSASFRERKANGWSRKIINFIPRGGGITSNPAGTNTTFDNSKINIIASMKITERDLAMISSLNAVLRRYGYRITEE